MGGLMVRERALCRTVANYERVVGVCRTDEVVIGANPKLREVARREAWPGTCVVGLPGPDGADKALLQYAEDHEPLASEFDRIVVGSGDHIFVSVVETFRAYGLPVEVVSLNRCLSGALVASASYIRILPGVGESRLVA